jgi:hypothetical protein
MNCIKKNNYSRVIIPVSNFERYQHFKFSILHNMHTFHVIFSHDNRYMYWIHSNNVMKRVRSASINMIATIQMNYYFYIVLINHSDNSNL